MARPALQAVGVRDAMGAVGVEGALRRKIRVKPGR